jgi:HD-like signal output (HDOD) protein
VLARLRALLNKARAPRAGTPAAGRAEAARPVGCVPVEEGREAPVGGAGEPAFARFARILGLERQEEAPPLAPEDEAEDARLAALVTKRFAASRPEPASFPAIALQILNLVASPDAQVSELARLVSRDPALSAGALSVANSAVYRGVQEFETVREAVARLGVVELGRVASAVSARTLFSPRSRAEQAAFGERWNALFGHAVAVGSAAATQALRHPGARSDRAYLGGLLHDVGKSLALSALAGLIADGAVAEPDGPRLERILDRVHVELGAEAHQIWELPHYLTVLCVRHHDEAIPADPEFVDLHLVRLTSALADLREPAFAARAAAEVVQSAGALGLDPYAARAILADLRQAEERSSAWYALGPTGR